MNKLNIGLIGGVYFYQALINTRLKSVCLVAILDLLLYYTSTCIFVNVHIMGVHVQCNKPYQSCRSVQSREGESIELIYTDVRCTSNDLMAINCPCTKCMSLPV